MLQKPNSAYFHIPFCSHICYYCDFAKVLMTGQPIDAYIEAIIEEFQSLKIKKLKNGLYRWRNTECFVSSTARAFVNCDS
ncbi:Oxygen-independent coproporphyrinogen-III oxidase-like protein [Lactococcus lactis]|nr:Oxygen-independent coproporphyrinogen-III oxidase-like protein [Lactococcus lactis]